METYSKNRLLNNIEKIVQDQNIKIGELELKCGVSVGYFSRLRKSESDSASPSLDILLSLSQQLNISLTSLVFCDFSKMTETEIFIQKFLERLVISTRGCIISWNKHSNDDFFTSSIFFNLKTFDYENTSVFNEPEQCYKSLFDNKIKFFTNDFFSFNSKENVYYLFCIRDDIDADLEFELYVETKSIIKPICTSNFKGNKVFKEMFSELYHEIECYFKKVILDNDVKKSMEDFVNETSFDVLAFKARKESGGNNND